MAELSEMPWYGWAVPGEGPGLRRAAERFVRGEIGLADRPVPPLDSAEVQLAPSRLSPASREALVAVLGAEQVRDDALSRLRHAGGKSYVDLIRRRRGDVRDAPDAVLLPDSHADVMNLLSICSEHSIAVVPFGGGTSVVGGVEPLRDGLDAVVAVDMLRMDRLLHLDKTSLLATFEPGIRGPAAEALLAAEGLTLGHFPQSYERASIGGYAATRSAGQASTGYGRIDEMVVALRCATPVGELRIGVPPASAAGPDLRQLLVGSEGALGVLTEVTLHVRKAPAVQRYEAWFFRDFAAGLETLRALAQDGASPDVVRLSDEEETRAALAMAGGGVRARIGARYLSMRGYRDGCLTVLGWEGSADGVRVRRRSARKVLRSAGGLPL